MRQKLNCNRAESTVAKQTTDQLAALKEIAMYEDGKSHVSERLLKMSASHKESVLNISTFKSHG